MEGTGIPLDWGVTTATLTHECLEMTLDFTRSTDVFQTGFQGSLLCCEYGTEPIKTVWGGVSYCVDWTFSTYGKFSFRSECDIACGDNANALFVGDQGEPVNAAVTGCSSETTVCTSSISNWTDCTDSGSVEFNNCDVRRRFYVGFQSDIGGEPVFGWIQVDTAGPTGLQITKWAYEDTGLEIALGEEPAPPSPVCEPDLNGDGIVDAADMGILLGKWGPCDP